MRVVRALTIGPIVFASLCVMSVAGCKMYTRVTSSSGFLLERDGVSCGNSVGFVVHGARGRAYVDQTRKKVFIRISSRYGGTGENAEVLSLRYVINASDLTMRIEQEEDAVAALILYDCGVGELCKQEGSNTRDLMMICFGMDQDRGKLTRITCSDRS